MITENNAGQPTIVVVDKQSGNTAGILSIGFGIIGIFVLGLIFVPLSMLTAIVALLKGQFFLGGIGLFLALIGVMTSPTIWLILGLSAAGSLAQS